MQLKKKELMEIIDSNGDLIGKNDTPTVDANADTQANNTTDYNAKIGTQPFRYDMLGRFGFTLMPFMEGKENQEQTNLLNELSGLMHNKFVEFTDYYIKHPNLLKPDNRKAKEESVGHNEACEKRDIKWAKEAIDIFQSNFEKAFKEPIDEVLTEAKVVEDKVVDKKDEDEMSNKSEDKEVRDKKIEKIAGLINKLEKKDIYKLKNLLERI
jgi:DNA-directed RNA polymerase subunit L